MSLSALIDITKRALVGGAALLLSLLFPAVALAFENPHLYYDWNHYYQPQEQILGVQAFAQEGATDSASPSASTIESDSATPPDHRDYKHYGGYVLGLGNLNPDNPFYFLKRAQEGIATTFTFDAKARQEVRLQIAGERLAEMEAMAEAGKADQVTSLANSYNSTMKSVADNLEKLKEQNQDVTSLLATTDVEAAKHTLVLEEVSLQVPPAADAGIQKALEASEHAGDTVADIVGRPAVPAEMITRLQSLKAQGLLTPEEVEKLIAVSSRVLAREEFRKLAQARVLPEADFRKLDEAARAYFPQGYANAVEIKKFKELKDLETQKPDDATLGRVQEFANNYKAGEIVPAELRRWWVPMVRLEELQNTIRPDLIRADSFRYRPDEQQKYKELVERVKPRQEDIEYVNRLVQTNPDILADPAYARIKALGDRFGAIEITTIQSQVPPQAQSCGRDAHWAGVPFMPGGGYCVPNLVYGPVTGGGNQGAISSCPPGYHRNDPQGACYPDNQYGPGIGGGPNIIGAPVGVNSCPAGYHRESAGIANYCAPDSPTIGGGPFPGPMPMPSYCPQGQIFQDGKCQTYNPPPKEGCPGGQYWTGSKCAEVKSCGAGYYQDQNGECKKSTFDGYPQPAVCLPPSGGCGFNAYYDYSACTCRSTSDYPGYPQPTGGGGAYPTPYSGSTCSKSPTECSANGGYLDYASCSCKTSQYYPSSPTTPSYSSCQYPSSGCSSGQYWDSGSCSCKTSTYTQPSGGTGGTTSTGCGSGYYWNGSYCASSGSTSTQTQTSDTQQTQTTTQEPAQTTTTTQTTSEPAPAPSTSTSGCGDGSGTPC